MSCSSNIIESAAASTSVIATSSSSSSSSVNLQLAMTQSDSNNTATTSASTAGTTTITTTTTPSAANSSHQTIKTITTSTSAASNGTTTTTQIVQPKSAIVHAGNQLIITTTATQVPKLVTQAIPTQKVVSVVPATLNGASSSTISSSSNGNTTNSSPNTSTTSANATTTNTTSDVSYPIQHYQTFNDSTIYPTTLTNAFYNANNQPPSNFPSTTTLASSETAQGTAVYYMYPDAQLELDNGFELDGHVSHTAQAAPITVQWLVDNFEPAEGCSLRRSSLYNFYMHHCSEQKIEPVNPASFGKLIRSVFLGLRTRRLGTRGNSKYHYYGIRVKASSPLNQIPEDHAIPSRSHAINPPKRLKSVYLDHEYKSSQANVISATPVNSEVHANNNTSNNNLTWSSQASITNSHSTSTSSTASGVNHHQQQAVTMSTANDQIASSTSPSIGNASSVTTTTTATTTPTTITTTNSITATTTPICVNMSVETEAKVQEFFKIINSLPNSHIITENIDLPDNCNLDDIKKFEDLYVNKCQKILDLVVNAKFNCIDDIWQKFWRCTSVGDANEYEQQLSNEKFIALCNVKPVIDFVKIYDCNFFQYCVDILIPDVLKPIPSNFTQQIRNFAKSLENWLKNSLVNVPEEMQQTKLKIINAFAMTLRRYTTLNHLAQASKALLQNPQQISQMLSDLNRVDFRTVQEQASWICNCDDQLINQIEKEFKKNLQNQCSLEDWAKWLDSVLTIYLEKYEGTEKYSKMAHHFLLKWSFYCSTIIRDLTLRSASSFGSFHLIRLLYDEYMFYLIEHKISKAVGETAIAVMSDLKLVATNQIMDD